MQLYWVADLCTPGCICKLYKPMQWASPLHIMKSIIIRDRKGLIPHLSPHPLISTPISRMKQMSIPSIVSECTAIRFCKELKVFRHTIQHSFSKCPPCSRSFCVWYSLIIIRRQFSTIYNCVSFQCLPRAFNFICFLALLLGKVMCDLNSEPHNLFVIKEFCFILPELLSCLGVKHKESGKVKPYYYLGMA